MKRRTILVLASLSAIPVICGAAACGGISDPNGSGPVATVSGELISSEPVPANAHVAFVWRTGLSGGFAVGADSAITNGAFSLNIPSPSQGYLFPADQDRELATSPDEAPPIEGSTGSSGGSGSGGSASGGGVAPQTVVRGKITGDMSVAVGGFIIYVDKNGNGQLDIGQDGESPDEMIGGNKDIFLAFLQGGGALDYEKLRDKSGVLPQQGFNLAWEDEERWLPLNLVELKLANRHRRLPSMICRGGGDAPVSSDVTYPAPAPAPGGNPTDPDTMDGGVAPRTYPDPNDPNLTCGPDGRSFSYRVDCPKPVPMPTPEVKPGVCGGYDDSPDIGYAEPGCASGYGESLADGEPIPEGWPCPVAQDGGPADAGPDATDGGPAPDAG